MANWKKVLVSGSAIEGTSLKIDGFVTMSATLPASTDAADLVLVQAAGGQIETRLQSDIQGVTTAVFKITGSDASNDTFDATGDQLVFDSNGDISVSVNATSGKSTLKLDTPSGTISGSQQITDLGFINSVATLIADISESQTSITALNNDSSSYAISASIIGTAGEIEVTANGDQGIQIGLPDDVTITGSLVVSQSITADTLVLTGLSLVDNNAAIISGSNIFGSDATDTHDFTGSVDILGAISASTLPTNNTVGILDILAVNSNGGFVKAGTAIQSQISGALSNTNTDVDALEASASQGIRFADTDSGFSVALTETASFAASGEGLAVNVDANTVTYTITPSDVLNTALSGSGLLSSSGQIAADISGAFENYDFGGSLLSGSGIISGAVEGDAQGQIKINGANVNTKDLGSDDSPTFVDLTLTGDLIVQGTTTTVNTTNLNIEDQFILINSGALTPDGQTADASDNDGGFIVDFGGGSGSAFFYNADSKAWAVKGTDYESATQTDFLGYNTVASNDLDNAKPDYIVSVVSQSLTNPLTPTTAPTYGDSTAKTDHGTMHVNTNTGDIWIYS